MRETSSERRLAENEVMFRELNEKIQSGVSETNRLAIEDEQPEFAIPDSGRDETLQFFCECADEKCTERVALSLRNYKDIHTARDQFVIVPGHQVPIVESIVSEHPGYLVVRKKIKPPKTATTLNPTSLDNT
jgi:hypothetical protein